MSIEGRKFPVNLEICNPQPGVVGLLKTFQYAEGYSGIPRRTILEAIRGNNQISTGETIMSMYGFKTPEESVRHFIDAQKTARGLIASVVYTMGLDPDRYSLKDEVKIPDPNVSRMLVYTNPRPNTELIQGSSKRTRFETLRELFLLDIALRLQARAINEAPYDVLSELQNEFNNTLYYGPSGESIATPYYFSFDDENAVGYSSSEPFDQAKIKVMDMRQIVEIGKYIKVRPDFDKKSSVSQVRKLLTDHLKSGKHEFDPLGVDPSGKPNLEDRQRFEFVVDGQDEEMLILANKIRPFFECMIEHPINNDHGQNATVKHRYSAQRRGIPVEVMIYDVRGHVNAHNHIGSVNPKTGIHSGSGHEFFEVRRGIPLLPYLWPFEVYGAKNQSREEYERELNEFAQIRSSELARSIRSRIR